jgi:hypothetical protein
LVLYIPALKSVTCFWTNDRHRASNMFSANLTDAIIRCSLPTPHFIVGTSTQARMSTVSRNQSSKTGALAPLIHYVVCSASYGPPMLAITPSNNFMWPGDNLMAHRTMIRGISPQKTIAERELERVVKDAIEQSEFMVYCLNLPDEVRLFSTASFTGASYLGKVYIESVTQLA